MKALKAIVLVEDNPHDAELAWLNAIGWPRTPTVSLVKEQPQSQPVLATHTQEHIP